MPLIYLDQNATIALGRKARGSVFREKLNSHINLGNDVFVFSLWHLVETSYGGNPARSGELAAFIESLAPLWLLERHQILVLDVSDDFCGYLRLDHKPLPRVVTRSAMFADLDSRTGGPSFRGTLAQFVELWRKHRKEGAYEQVAMATTRLRRANKSGKLTEAMKTRAALNMIESVLPQFTPSGLAISIDRRRDYLNQVNPSKIPSVALDMAISEFDWRSQSNPGRNTQIDRFHLLSALPYVDFVATDDHFSHQVYPSASRTGHVRARLLHNHEFMERF